MKTRIAIGCVVFLVVALVVFPKSASAASEEVIYSFTGGADGGSPVASLLLGQSLYGTTSAGGAYGYGTVFALTPPATGGGSWTEQVLYSFTGGGDGSTPLAPLIADKAGTLYGTTSAGGAAFYNNGYGTVFA
jgi:uncharacterized repeat protein (TIGR03803 family)